jgi:hypothetical protein
MQQEPVPTAQDLSDGLINGGPVSILWGLALVAFCNTCVALSLAGEDLLVAELGEVVGILSALVGWFESFVGLHVHSPASSTFGAC